MSLTHVLGSYVDVIDEFCARESSCRLHASLGAAHFSNVVAV